MLIVVRLGIMLLYSTCGLDVDAYKMMAKQVTRVLGDDSGMAFRRSESRKNFDDWIRSFWRYCPSLQNGVAQALL